MIKVFRNNGYYFDDSITDETSGIEDLDLRVADYKYLHSLGFETIGQLLEHDGWYYFNLPRHSLRALEAFFVALDNLGFRLKDASKEEYPDLDNYIMMFRQAEKEEQAAELKRLEREDRAERRRQRKMAALA